MLLARGELSSMSSASSSKSVSNISVASDNGRGSVVRGEYTDGSLPALWSNWMVTGCRVEAYGISVSHLSSIDSSTPIYWGRLRLTMAQHSPKIGLTK